MKKDDKFGYIDNKGNEIIPIIYSYCGEVYNDFVAVGNGGKYGFISINDGKKICELIYDKVEAFGDNGLAKVVLNQKFGYIDKTGKEIVPIEYDYTEENYDFTGEWKATDIHSSKAGSITISGQIATSFNFEILAKYFSKTGTIVGTADIIKPNVAEYKYTSRNIEEIITFSIIDEKLIITAKSGGNCGMDNELIVTGTYTLDTPKYTNDKVMTKVFNDDEEFFGRIKTLLGEDIYSEYFLYGFKNGEYKYKKIDDASAVMKGKLYTVTVPTMKKDFKLFISDENKIYFFAKHEEIYITDDLERQSIARKPSVIAFDEL